MNEEIAICSVAFGDLYLAQMERLKESVQLHNPDAKLFFYKTDLPEGARPMYESLYGFKPHAIHEAIKAGYRRIFWFDPAIIVQKDIRQYCKMAQNHRGVLAVQDDTPLADVCSQNAVNHFGIRRSYLCGKHLVGGSFYYFDFSFFPAFHVFNAWLEAEKKGIFGSQQQEASEQLQGHRADETCMALSMYQHEVDLLPYGQSGYDNNQNPIIIKKHFK